jgi:hypothetical protein
MVLAWNRDIATFSALVEAAALDVHAFIALVNNGRYGDSRVRAPAKESFRRDVVRVHGGECDYLTIAKLDIAALRAFQSRKKAWPRDDDQFKPVPEGFQMHPRRATLAR